jgi:hypothetical protein
VALAVRQVVALALRQAVALAVRQVVARRESMTEVLRRHFHLAMAKPPEMPTALLLVKALEVIEPLVLRLATRDEAHVGVTGEPANFRRGQIRGPMPAHQTDHPRRR